eukprot:gnl/MRDRNA2_/MRDRNA2_36578_c0_seq1.p1 gnl/MRDRNA2_/MRDRNA2_36578_c0~~gnl/MRDRNA2_/MRDRNA2_36578_c0_seq1.p1  ORF type:complete len:348 (+),score=66.18 gnl/MRDRNA2_/MRDRNA2_36578_c0_seq1:50-1045(+)
MAHLTGPAQLQSLLQDLPVVLRAKMLQHMHHGRHLNLEFFSRYRDDDLFALIVPLLSSAHFHTDDLIYLRGDYAECMYFLTKGVVVFFTRKDEQNHPKKQREVMDTHRYLEIQQDMLAAEPFQIIVDGTTFGDFELLLGLPRQTCARCEMVSDCLHLHKKDLLRVLAEFPVMAECMRSDAHIAYHATMKLKVAHALSEGIELHDGVSKVSTADNHMSQVANERMASDETPSLKESPGPAVQRTPSAIATSPSLAGDHDSPPLAHRSQQMEERLKFIEMKQDTMMQMMKEMMDEMTKERNAMTTERKEMQEMRTKFFSMDLRIQAMSQAISG